MFENQLRDLSILNLNAAVSDNRQRTPEAHVGTLSTSTSVSSQVSPNPSPPNNAAHQPQEEQKHQQQQPTVTHVQNENGSIKRDQSPSAAALKNLFEAAAAAQAKAAAAVTPRSPLSPSISPHTVARPAVMAEDVKDTASGQKDVAGGVAGEGEEMGGEVWVKTENGINGVKDGVNAKNSDDNVVVSANIPTEPERRKDGHHGWSIRREMVHLDGLFSPIAMPNRVGRGGEGARGELLECNAPVSISRKSLTLSGNKGRHVSHSDFPEQRVVDALMSTLHQTQLELMVTREELLVEHGKRLKAQEACAQHATEIAMLTSNLEAEQQTVAMLKECLDKEQAARPASRHVVVEEERQLHLCRALSHFVLVCLQDKLQWLCVEQQAVCSGAGHTTSRQLATLRNDCASDLKSLQAVCDVITALVATRDNAGMSPHLSTSFPAPMSPHLALRSRAHHVNI
jgi:hypothetical protein